MICWRQLEFWGAVRIFASERRAGAASGKVECVPLEFPERLALSKWLLSESSKTTFAVSVVFRRCPSWSVAAYFVFLHEGNVAGVTQIMAISLAKNIASKAMQLQKAVPGMSYITYDCVCVVRSVGRFSNCQLK